MGQEMAMTWTQTWVVLKAVGTAVEGSLQIGNTCIYIYEYINKYNYIYTQYIYIIYAMYVDYH